MPTRAIRAAVKSTSDEHLKPFFFKPHGKYPCFHTSKFPKRRGEQVMRALGALKALPSLTPEVGPQSENVFSSPNPFSPRSGHTATNHLPPSAYSPVRGSPRGQRALAELCGGWGGRAPSGLPYGPAAMLMAFISLGFDRQLKPDSSAAWP